MTAPVLLLTRPEAASRRFAADCSGLGVRIVVAPLQKIVPVPHDGAALARAAALVFTSPVAVPAAGPGRGRLAICVGPGTAMAAAAAGFTVQVSATGEAGGMLPLIEAHVGAHVGAHAGAMLHPHGRHLARELPVPGMVVYDQQAMPLGEEGRRCLAGTTPVILPLFSPRSARLAAAAVAGARAPLRPVAISAAAAACWQAVRPEAARIAALPDAAAMLAAVRAMVAEQLATSPVEAGRPAL